MPDVVTTSPNVVGDISEIGRGLQELGKSLPSFADKQAVKDSVSVAWWLTVIVGSYTAYTI